MAVVSKLTGYSVQSGSFKMGISSGPVKIVVLELMSCTRAKIHYGLVGECNSVQKLLHANPFLTLTVKEAFSLWRCTYYIQQFPLRAAMLRI